MSQAGINGLMGANGPSKMTQGRMGSPKWPNAGEWTFKKCPKGDEWALQNGLMGANGLLKGPKGQMVPSVLSPVPNMLLHFRNR